MPEWLDKPRTIGNWLWFVPGAVWAATIFVLSVLPSKEMPVCSIFGIPVDKVGHFSCYGTLVFLFLPAIQKQYGQTKRRLTAELVLVGTAIAYGISIEFVQRMPIVSRSFDVNDMVANGVGCFCGYIVYKVMAAWMLAASRPSV